MFHLNDKPWFDIAEDPDVVKAKAKLSELRTKEVELRTTIAELERTTPEVVQQQKAKALLGGERLESLDFDYKQALATANDQLSIVRGALKLAETEKDQVTRAKGMELAKAVEKEGNAALVGVIDALAGLVRAAQKAQGFRKKLHNHGVESTSLPSRWIEHPFIKQCRTLTGETGAAIFLDAIASYWPDKVGLKKRLKKEGEVK